MVQDASLSRRRSRVRIPYGLYSHFSIEIDDSNQSAFWDLVCVSTLLEFVQELDDKYPFVQHIIKADCLIYINWIGEYIVT